MPTGLSLLSNSIHSNDSWGIAWESGGTSNDPGDTDGVPNYPVLDSVSESGEISGNLSAKVGTGYRVEFFSNRECDNSGHGEGENFLGFQTVTTDGSGAAAISFNAVGGLLAGHFITTTATGSGDSTSEFSKCLEVGFARDISPPDFSNIVVTEASGLQSGGTITAPFTPVFTWSGITDGSGLLQYLYYFNQCDDVFPTFISDTEGAAGNPLSPTVTLAPIQEGAYGCYELSLIAQDTAGNSSDLIPVFRFTCDKPKPTQADLTLIKTADQAEVPVGNNLVYRMTVTNYGPDGATGVTLNDPIPAGATYVTNNGGCEEAGGVLTCQFGPLGVGGTAVVDLVVTLTSPGTVKNTATVAADQTDPNPGNNTATEATTVTGGQLGSADLALIKTADQAEVPVGNNLVYRMTVTNHGPDGVTGVTLTDPIPAGATYVSNNGGCEEAGGVLTCQFGPLGVGSTAVVDLAVTATSPGTVTNTATVAADQADPNPANNTASRSTSVTEPPPAVPGDVNRDGKVDIEDLRILLASLGTRPPTDPNADVNGDGQVDILDMVEVARNFGRKST